MSKEINITLTEIEKQIYDYALKSAKIILDENKDLNPHVQFRYNSKDPNVMEKLIKNTDATTFLTMLDYQINDKFIVVGQVEAKIYYLLFKELGLLKNENR